MSRVSKNESTLFRLLIEQNQMNTPGKILSMSTKRTETFNLVNLNTKNHITSRHLQGCPVKISEAFHVIIMIIFKIFKVHCFLM